MKTNIEEKLVPIGQRVPPGDRWTMINSNKKYIAGSTETSISENKDISNSLIEFISRYQRSTGFSGAYRFEPKAGKIYAILENEVQVQDPEEYFDIYGEH